MSFLVTKIIRLKKHDNKVEFKLIYFIKARLTAVNFSD